MVEFRFAHYFVEGGQTATNGSWVPGLIIELGQDPAALPLPAPVIVQVDRGSVRDSFAAIWATFQELGFAITYQVTPHLPFRHPWLEPKGNIGFTLAEKDVVTVEPGHLGLAPSGGEFASEAAFGRVIVEPELAREVTSSAQDPLAHTILLQGGKCTSSLTGGRRGSYRILTGRSAGIPADPVLDPLRRSLLRRLGLPEAPQLPD